MKTRVIFFGSSIHSLPILSRLIGLDYLRVIACVTQPDRPAGRKQILTATPVADFTKKHKLPIIKPDSNPKTPWKFLNPKGLKRELQKDQPDLFIVCYYGQKIPMEIISLARYGGLNIHPSLLPKYRGAAPAEWAILNGEKEAGVTVLTVEKNFDSGKIVAQEKEMIKDTDTAEDLYQRLFIKGADLLVKILPGFLNKTITLLPQDNTKATSAPRLTKTEGKIDWLKTPEQIERKIRAFYPWPGTFTFVRLDKTPILKRLKILKAVLTEGRLIPKTVQLEGKKPVSYTQFQKAFPDHHFT